MILLLVFSSVKSGAQDAHVAYRDFGIDDGIPHREVNTIFQDSRGYMWIGTPRGIARYDGYQFKKFNAASYGFINENIWRILEDAEGWFWLIPNKPGADFDIWHPLTGERTSFLEKFGGVPVPGCHPGSWIRSETDKTLVANIDNSQLFVYHPDREGLWVRLSDSTLDMKANSALISAGEYIWAITQNNTISKISWDGKTEGLIKHNQPLEFERSLHSRSLPVIYFEYDENGRNTSYILSREGKSIPLNTNYAYPVLVPFSKTGNLNEDLVFDLDRFHTADGLRISESPDSVYWTVGSIHRSIFFDDRGDLWSGNDFGIRQWNVRPRYFNSYLSGHKIRKAIRGIHANGDTAFVNVEHFGPAIVDLGTQSHKALKIENAGFGYFTLLKLSDGHYLSGQYYDIIEFDEQFKEVSRVPVPHAAWASLELDNGLILCGSRQGLYYFNRITGESKPFTAFNRYRELQDAFVTHLEYDDERNIRICCDKGFYTLSEESGIISKFSKTGKPDREIPYDLIYHYYQDKNGNTWLASGGGGLIKVPRDTTSAVEQIRKEDGLSDNVIYAVYPDVNNNLWMSSDMGIIRLNSLTNDISVYLEVDGIPNNEFNRLAHFMDSSGKLFFGGIDGFVSFDPEDLMSSALEDQYALVVTRVNIFDDNQGQTIDATGDFLQSNAIVIKPGNRYFSLEMALLNYRDELKNKYYYRFPEKEENWNLVNDHVLRFEGLAYGDHILELRAQGAQGSWSENTMVIPISVRKPYYLQIWFFILFFTSALLISYMLFRIRTKGLLKRQKALEEIIEDRTKKLKEERAVILEQSEKLKSLESLKSRFFANISHELRTPLSLIIGPLDKLSKKKQGMADSELKLVDLARRNSRKLLKLVNEILDISRLEKSEISIEEDKVPFFEFLSSLVRQFRSLAKEKSIRISLEYEYEKDVVLVMDLSKTEKIISNYLTNAIKYTGRGGQVIVRVTEARGRILLAVKDNGKGINEADLPYIFNRFYRSSEPANLSKSGTGIGLSLVRELSDLMQAKVWAESKPGEGSTFYYEFRMIKARASHGSRASTIEDSAILPELAYGFDELDTNGTEELLPDKETRGSRMARLLIVEDNPELQWYLEEVLGDEYHVTCCNNGREALEKLLDGREQKENDKHMIRGAFDLIITDLMMPEMDGFEFLGKIKNHDLLRHIPCIVLTARADVSVKLKVLRVGVDDYVLKPFLVDELKTRVKNLINNLDSRIRFISKEKLHEGKDTNAGQESLIGSADIDWLADVEGVFSKYLSSNDFKLDRVADELYVSERHLRRKLKQLTGLSPNQYHREMRLQKAREYIQKGSYKSIKQISNAVGFSSTKYFSRLFEKRFGIVPSRYADE